MINKQKSVYEIMLIFFYVIKKKSINIFRIFVNMPVKKRSKRGGLRKGVVDKKDNKLIRFHQWARVNGVKLSKDTGRGSASVSVIKQRAKKMGISIPSEYLSLGM